ncbi:hypothetical protein FC093_07720 [Ilyomonas limi]|uniref:Uncharacterized protein n=1 Tax=Ilyomonas limi TaxID=2575867 RepID=A0A4U3L4E7_9BACT|nr:hypothetical protein [Ilyomonas limi]TKK69199.1 hypothetical protein FC093_07720 [Ilyomonas limi]
MKFITLHIVYSVAIVIGILVLFIYILFIRFRAPFKAKPVEDKDKPQERKGTYRKFGRFSEWNLN